MRRIGGRLRSGYSGSCGVIVEIPPFAYLRSNPARSRGQFVEGSLTGVVASKSVTEASKGTLRPIGNRSQSVMA